MTPSILPSPFQVHVPLNPGLSHEAVTHNLEIPYLCLPRQEHREATSPQSLLWNAPSPALLVERIAGLPEPLASEVQALAPNLPGGTLVPGPDLSCIWVERMPGVESKALGSRLGGDQSLIGRCWVSH